MWKPGITSWAQNVDYYQPALVAVTNYDDAPISYSSTSRYLTAYTDVDKNASAPASHQAPGYLGKPSAGVDETLDWKFDSLANNVRVGPVTVIDQVFGLNGNWATLCELKPVVISLAVAQVMRAWSPIWAAMWSIRPATVCPSPVSS